MKINFKVYQSGYTLIEMLTVVGLIVVVGTIIAAIMVTSLRGSNKTANLNQIRQNGNYIIGQMSKGITYAKVFNGVSNNSDPNSFITSCVVSPAPANPVEYNYIKFTDFNDNQITYVCNDNGTNNSSINSFINSNDPDSLTNNNIAVTNCYFYCIQNSVSESPKIQINFTLSAETNSAFFENTASSEFKTTVNIRNN